MTLPNIIHNEEQLEEWLSTPTNAVIQTFSQLTGDIVILGAGGKMGPTLAKMAQKAVKAAQNAKSVYAVSRFSDPAVRTGLENHGLHTISGDLLNRGIYSDLPDAENVVYMAGKKFGSTQHAWDTWAMNAYVPALVMERYPQSRIVAFSTGNVYPLVSVESGGSKETDPPEPVGEYAQSCLGRERIIEYFSRQNGTAAALIRLNYAVEMRYGVLVELAEKVMREVPIDLSMGYVNVIWQGDANAYALQALASCCAPPSIVNVTGPEILSVRRLAEQFGERFGKTLRFIGEESPTALLNDARQTFKRFGRPQVPLETIMDWTVEWLNSGRPTWNKPTHFQTRDGQF